MAYTYERLLVQEALYISTSLKHVGKVVVKELASDTYGHELDARELASFAQERYERRRGIEQQQQQQQHELQRRHAEAERFRRRSIYVADYHEASEQQLLEFFELRVDNEYEQVWLMAGASSALAEPDLVDIAGSLSLLLNWVD